MRYPELLCAINRRVNGDAAAIGHPSARPEPLLGQSRATQVISKLAAVASTSKSRLSAVTDREPGTCISATCPDPADGDVSTGKKTHIACAILL